MYCCGRQCTYCTYLLCLVRPVEVISRYAALGAGHVPPDDEVGAPEVLADHHVLHGLWLVGWTLYDGNKMVSKYEMYEMGTG